MNDSGSDPVLTPDGSNADPAPEAVAGTDPLADDGSNGLTELRDDLSALVDDARTYAEAEIAFQKTRARLVTKVAGRALVLLVLAVVLLLIALVALAVGMLIALAPLVTIWGAIAIVVGVLLVGVGVLALIALRDGKLLTAMVTSEARE